MPRKRRRLTYTKKKTIKVSGGDPESPTQEEWETSMTQFGSFVVTDDEDEKHQFSQGDHALILPNAKEPDEDISKTDYWVAKIAEIRAKANPEKPDVWVKVQWYYSGSDVATVLKSIGPDAFGEYERLLSDHFDFVSPQSFSKAIKVQKYDELSLDQEQISSNDFFCRYTFEHRARIIDPKPVGTCFCQRPYNPSTDTMHFCPRPSCRKAYHRDCLITSKSLETARTKHDRHLRLITASPDDDTHFDSSDLVVTLDQTRKGAKPNVPLLLKSSAEILISLPPVLVNLAKQQITKGALGGGVVGNIRSVTTARRLIYQAVEDGILRDDWQDIITNAEPIPGEKRAVVGKKPIKTEKWELLLCPSCNGPV